MHTYVDISEELYFQTMISELGIGIATSNFGLALNALWKKSSSFIHLQPYNENGSTPIKFSTSSFRQFWKDPVSDGDAPSFLAV